MKPRSWIAVVVIATFFAASLHAQDEKAAIKEFKKQMEEVQTQMKREEAAAKGHRSYEAALLGGLLAVRNSLAKMKGVKTDGLPADFKEAFVDLVKTTEKMGEPLKEFPEKLDELEGYLKKMGQEDPKFSEKLIERLQPIEALADEAVPKQKKLAEIGKKYGLERIPLFSK